jgi:epidermal growth factor receptor substrate 15
LRGIACAGAWALASACGPTLVDGPFADGTGGASGSASAGDTTFAQDDGTSVSVSASVSASMSESVSASATASATATETASATASATATETASATATLDDSGTGEFSSSSISMVSCQDDGTIAWLVEVYVLAPIDGCVPPVDVSPNDILLIGIDEWDGEAGTYDVGQGEAIAVMGVETLSGSLTLDVSAPYHPSTLDYDLAGTSSMHTGTLDLAPCSFVEEPPCEAATTG